MKTNELNLKMIVPPATVGILVVASGICFILFSSFRRGKTGTGKNEKKVPVDDSCCACCLKPFIIGRGVQCNDCSARFCRKGCGRWEVKDNVWRCLFCYHRRTWLGKKEKWFETFSGAHSTEESSGQFSTAKSQAYVPGVEHGEINSGVDLAAGGNEKTDSLENIREIIEKVVEGLVGNVDDAPIDRLYQHSSYKPATDTPSMAHTALRELVERAVDEARKLPGLGDSVTIRRQDNTSIGEQSYEDLLAAAILNKVVEKYQKGRVDGNSNVVHETTSKRCRYRGSEASGSGVEEDSSVDPMSQDECGSECSRTKTKLRIRQEPLSLTIEEQIEEVTTTYTSDEEPRNVKANVLHFRNAKRVPFPEFGMDIVDPSQDSSEDSEDEVDACVSVDHITPLETWEQNWLFQRKKIAAQPEPVAMLVPNPSEDYRALIGDKDADDMSDLSEFSAQSDEEIDEDLIEAINQAVPDSPKVVRVPSGVQKTKSAILHDNFTGEIVCENSNDVQHPDKSSSGPKIKSEIVKGEKNPDEELKINDTEIEATEGGENYSREDTTRNPGIKEDRNKIPKTPTATPIRNSICEGDPALPVACDLQELNEKLIAIDDSDDNEDKVVDHLKSHSPDVAPQLELEKSEQFLHNVVEHDNALQNERSPLENGETLNNAPACQVAAAAAKARATSSIETKSNEEGHALSAPPRPGTIAEREHKKWENAAPIQNNPYSEENIQKRLLERQYASRSSDAPGSGVLPTSPSPPLKIVLGGNRPDVQRFARDYYINEAKSPTGERHRRPGTSNSSRPSSSLSQTSASTSSDYEHQESFELIEASPKPQNNRETEPQEVIEEFLERERKNSKNEINAKLNNQGNFDSPIFDSKKSFTEENNRKIRRIDLRAYGFANEFDESNEIRKKPPRVVNKLDLRSYGYDSGLRRTQSNNHIDSKVNNSFVRPKLIDDKSNLTQNHSSRLGGGDYIWTQSTDDLNKEREIIFDKLGGMTAAKSVPNIAKSSSFSYNGNKNSDDGRVNGSRDNGVDSYDSDSQNSKTESAEELPRKLPRSKEMRYSLESLEGPDRFIDAALPMPSVRRLAQAFNAPPEVKPTPVPRVNKPVRRDRPTTPEIHIVKTPRQMHSLTARSLSREFREGLRNISCKPNAQPVYSTIIEQSKVPAGSVSNGTENDDKRKVIASGNLRNNIQFWEQLQRKP
ncbi:uncharacterized protein LOC107048955 isoform X2 [Diachasma alloeum]|uniref:uncharacterized protein LOC107048955 isoform X2 n=1 Tax=Diachasma alloeum TaxID=454923 RepID=UPI0007381DEE|nr:uncharacterized protein LOC107048955 isoform X2 [Diachasma alloeum]